MKNILLTAPTLPEIQPCILKFDAKQINNEIYQAGNLTILVTGAGMMSYTYSLANYLLNSLVKPDLIILAGIAGCFNEGVSPGTLYEVYEEILADCGAEDKDGKILMMEELGFWAKTGSSQMFGSRYVNKQKYTHLTEGKSLSVNLGSGTKERINYFKRKHNADIENMEGAALFMICQRLQYNFTEIRSISNFIEPRNRNNWNIDLAINNLNTFLEVWLKPYL